MLNNWSFSWLMHYEACPLRVKLAKIDRLPEPPLAANNPMVRGNRVHEAIEGYTKGHSELPAEAKGFHAELAHLRDLYTASQSTAEQDWFFDQDWNPTTRENVWLWVKLDHYVQDGSHGIPIDYKTGKSGYKALQHMQQMQLYSAAVVCKYPEIESITAELWYLDENWVRSQLYTREDALRLVGRFQRRADIMMSDKLFRPRPNKVTCRWCPYNSKGTAACPVSAV